LGVLPRLFDTADFGEGTSRNTALGRYVVARFVFHNLVSFCY
jgi:hypothetical protein